MIFSRIFNLGFMSNTISSRFSSTGVRGQPPSAMDKRLLLYFKRYKTPEEIPNVVSYETIHKVRGKARMYLATIIMTVTLIGCYAMVRSGKKAAQRGEFVARQNLEWHKQINEGLEKK